jgi:hypothetical protein
MGRLSHEAHPHWLYPTQNIPFGGMIRKYNVCAFLELPLLLDLTICMQVILEGPWVR